MAPRVVLPTGERIGCVIGARPDGGSPFDAAGNPRHYDQIVCLWFYGLSIGVMLFS